MAAQTLWSEFLGRLLLGATLATPVAAAPAPAGQDPAPRPAIPAGEATDTPRPG